MILTKKIEITLSHKFLHWQDNGRIFIKGFYFHRSFNKPAFVGKNGKWQLER
jgi:hypothetical protein